MKKNEPFVEWVMDCWGGGEIAQAPDLFRVRITEAVMTEFEALLAFRRQANLRFANLFNGRSLGRMEVPVDFIEAQSSEEDESADLRLTSSKLCLTDEGIKLVSYMRIAGAELASDTISEGVLNVKFTELRALLTQQAVSNAIDATGGDVAPARKPKGMAL